jgi:hypothetical protein
MEKKIPESQRENDNSKKKKKFNPFRLFTPLNKISAAKKEGELIYISLKRKIKNPGKADMLLIP